MESNIILIILGVLLFSIPLIYLGIKGILTRRASIGRHTYKGWKAITASIIRLLVGLTPYMVLSDYLISRIFNLKIMYPIVTVSFGIIAIVLIAYSYARKEALN